MKSRDHRARVTQILIQKALTKLLREKPIHRISVKELCEEAGINRGTFYAHYTDIYDLLKQMEDDLVADLQKAMEPLMREDAQEPTLVGITSVIFRCLKENADICTVTLGPYGDREFVGRLLDSARESCLAVYARNFDATPWQLECYYASACWRNGWPRAWRAAPKSWRTSPAASWRRASASCAIRRARSNTHSW